MELNQVKIILKGIVEKYIASNDLNYRIELAKEHTEILLANIKLFEDDYYGDTVPDYEVWKNVIGYEGVYQISNFGSIKALERFFIKNRKGGKEKMAVYQPEKIRTRRYNPNGYLTIAFWLNGKYKHRIVHRLVAIHFIPNPNNYPQVLHNDDDPKNARWNNLEWGTQSKNIQDAADRNRGFKGVKNGMSKLKEEDIPKIRKLILDGVPSRKIAKMFGVTKTPILWIRNNKSWKHIK